MKKTIITIFLSMTIFQVGLFGKDLRENKNYSKNDPRAYTRYDLKHNIEVVKKVTKNISTKRLDNNVWVYTQEFAERFNMPKRWIGDKNFKGALALAYRDEIYKVRTCGYFQSWEGCREFEDECVLDIYVPNDSKTIPWNTEKQYSYRYGGGAYNSPHWLKFYKDFEGKVLTPQGKKDLESFRGYEGDWVLGGRVGIDSVTWAHKFKSDGFGKGGGGYVRSFHRNIFEGIDLISIDIECRFARSGDKEMQIWLSSMNDHATRKAKYAEKHPDAVMKNGLFRKFYHRSDFPVHHKIYMDKNFMIRMEEYKEANKSSSFFEYFKKNINKNTNNK